MTLTIDLTPAEEANLTAAARQEGLDPAALLKRLMAQLAPTKAADAPTFSELDLREPHRRRADRERERRLVEEYHALVDREEHGGLSDAQQVRLRQVEAELDGLEDQDPVAQAADRRLQETSDKLDEILALLRSLPHKDAPQ